MTAPASPSSAVSAEPRPRPTDAVRLAAAELYAAGARSAREVGEQFGRSSGWVLDQARRFHRRPVGPPRKGPPPTCRTAAIPEIVRRLQAGETQRAIGRAIRCNVLALVWAVRHGHVHAPELLALVGPARRCVRR